MPESASWGVYLPGSLRRGVPAWSGGGGVPAWSWGGVPAWSWGVYLPGPGGTCLVLGVYLPGPGGVPAWSGGTCLVLGGVLIITELIVSGTQCTCM